jgi:hypothetical protein
MMKFRMRGNIGQGEGVRSLIVLPGKYGTRAQRQVGKFIPVSLPVTNEQLMEAVLGKTTGKRLILEQQINAELERRITAQEKRIDKMQERIDNQDNLIGQLAKNNQDLRSSLEVLQTELQQK